MVTQIHAHTRILKDLFAERYTDTHALRYTQTYTHIHIHTHTRANTHTTHTHTSYLLASTDIPPPTPAHISQSYIKFHNLTEHRILCNMHRPNRSKCGIKKPLIHITTHDKACLRDCVCLCVCEWRHYRFRIRTRKKHSNMIHDEDDNDDDDK